MSSRETRNLEQFPGEPPPRFVARRPQRQSSERADQPRTDRSVASPGRGAGLGEFAQLAPFVNDPEVTDVFVNGPHQLWVDRGNGLVPFPPLPLDESQLRDLAVRLIAAGVTTLGSFGCESRVLPIVPPLPRMPMS